MIAFGALLSPEPPRAATPSLLPANFSTTRTCPVCDCDWATTDTCFCCGGPGIRVAQLPRGAQAAHNLSTGRAVHAHNPEEPTCPV